MSDDFMKKHNDDYELQEEYDLSQLPIMPKGRFPPEKRVGSNLMLNLTQLPINFETASDLPALEGPGLNLHSACFDSGNGFGEKLTVSEYFAGIGLVRMGLESGGWRVVFANDISEKKHEMYQAFFPKADHEYIIGDIFDLDPRIVPHSTLATCSFPCIDLSLAGNFNGIHGKHSSAFWGFTKILAAQGENAPPYILVENVPGWLYSNDGADFRVTVQSLNELGYTCDAFALDARRFTPQSRLRIFLIGSRLQNPGSAHSILTRPHSLLPTVLKKRIAANRDLCWFANAIPAPPSLRSDGLSRIVEHLEEADPRWWSETEVKRHIDMMEASHFKRVNELRMGDKVSYRTFFRRRRKGQQRAEVRHDDLSGCLRTAAGGSGKQFLIEAGQGNVRMRTMTPREYARLQGVPDHYPITVDGVQAFTGFGDAVCVPVITWIARNILNPLIEKQLAVQLQPG